MKENQTLTTMGMVGLQALRLLAWEAQAAGFSTLHEVRAFLGDSWKADGVLESLIDDGLDNLTDVIKATECSFLWQ